MPLSIWNWQDSLRAVLSDKAYVVSEFEDLSVRSVSAMYFLPSVIVLKSFHSRPTKIRGGKLTWLNTVTACTSCNFMKGHTLPEDLPRIGMKLKSAPRIPSYSELQYKAKLYSKTQIHPHWTDFI
jgi:5-methylcytosine-specific restriction endonuclease McrA